MSENRSREELGKVGSQSSFSGSMEIIEVSWEDLVASVDSFVSCSQKIVPVNLKYVYVHTYIFLEYRATV
jgi:hypothetical protein